MIGSQGQRLLGWAQLKNRTAVAAGEVARALALTPSQERKLLSRLARQGLLTRVKRGQYILPAKLPPGERWNPGEYVLLAGLMQSLGAKYQVGGPNAFQAYGLDTQVPNLIYVYNDRLSGRRSVGGLPFVFIKVASRRLGGAVIQQLPDGGTFWRAGLPRTLMDAVYDWPRFNTLPRAFHWIREQSQDSAVRKELALAAMTYGNIATRKRIGYLLESLGYSSLARTLLRSVARNPSLIPFDPSRPSRGRTVRRWGLIDNRAP
jgi:predicted transcriptional regulator of viral defense system